METLEGIVERVTFYNPENGYSVVRLQAPHRSGRRSAASRPDDLVTIVGNLPEVIPGETLRLEGAWAMHPVHGQQFKVETCRQILPGTVNGIQRYLGSGLIKGIGPKTAERIVTAFGEATFDVIEHEPERLREVPDIGPKRARIIRAAWAVQKQIKEVMVFLHSHGIATGLATRVYRHYGDDSLHVVRTDPYRLARDIYGIGFKTADKIARALGLPMDSPTRVEAGVAYALNELADEGHVYAPQDELVARAAELLQVPPEDVLPAIGRLAGADRVKVETVALHPVASPRADRAAGEVENRLRESRAAYGTPRAPSAVREERAVYLTPFYHGEVGVSARLQGLLESRQSRLALFEKADWEALFERLADESAKSGAALRLTQEQRAAVQTALSPSGKVTVLTGGPGTGKTTTLRALIRALEIHRRTFALASPTGRAAKRLSEATGRPAQTIHRLLGYSPDGGFEHDERHKLPVDMLVIDEASMVDLLLMNHVLKAVHPASHLLLVGDVDQLPSVGAGDVLRDIIASERARVIRLSYIFRQAEDSSIVANAHRINQGKPPLFPADADDFFLFPADEPEQAAEWVVDIVKNRIPARFGLDPVNDVQVLAPMHRGVAGVAALNQRLQEALNPASPRRPERQLMGRVFRVGDKVMQTSNNYDKEVYNGDIGRIAAISPEAQTLTVVLDGRRVAYDWSEADELTHAFAISVHKSQGSEYPAVVMPILTHHYLMLQRNLLYTAVTRARRLCVLVGSKRAIGIATRNAPVNRRYTALDVRLKAAGVQTSDVFETSGV